MKVKKIADGHILFDDGTRIEYYHGQDCCEQVYADFKQLSDTNIFGEDFKELKIEGVKDAGINLNGYFIPCYNEQNGYYSDQLEIIITHPDGREEKQDISEFVEDKIC